MLITITYGYAEDRNSDGHGLARLAAYLAKYFGTVQIHEWKDDVAAAILAVEHSPLIMVGHSFGAARSIHAARILNAMDVPVDHLFILDGVPLDGSFLPNNKEWVIPGNVKRATCYWRKPWIWPLSRPILNESAEYQNVPLSIGHSAFNNHPKVWSDILLAATELANAKLPVVAAAA